jgi:hypothetical protein
VRWEVVRYGRSPSPSPSPGPKLNVNLGPVDAARVTTPHSDANTDDCSQEGMHDGICAMHLHGVYDKSHCHSNLEMHATLECAYDV